MRGEIELRLGLKAVDIYGLSEAAAGELVITTLTKQALPMIRYRTRDITRLARERCACGRTHLRIRRITGRNDDKWGTTSSRGSGSRPRSS